MKVQLLTMRLNGVALSRADLRHVPIQVGELEIVDTRENSYNRILKIGRFRSALHNSAAELFDVHILWMAGDKFALTGFERQHVDGAWVDYAQSWICRVGEPLREYDNASMMPPREDFRM
jgi:hypothetical protein